MTFLNNVWPNSFIKLFSLREYKILLLLLFCIIIFSSAEIISSSESKRILSIESKTYKAVEKFGEVEKVKLSCVEIEKYNEYGNLMERVIHDADTNDNIIYGNKFCPKPNEFDSYSFLSIIQNYLLLSLLSAILASKGFILNG